MSSLRTPIFVVTVSLLIVNLALAGDYAVGTCKPKLPSYSTISAAVSSVPAGSTVEVCPGTYAEQVFIGTALTLEGIPSANSTDVVITVPGGGLTTVTDDLGITLAPQLVVTSPLNISNVTLDATGNGVGCTGTWLPGIFYGHGASGTVNGVTFRNISACGFGTGIWASSSTSESVTVENSSFHDIDDSSVISLGSVDLTAKGNSMEAFCYNAQLEGAHQIASGNFISSASCGTALQTFGPGTISGNTITNPFAYGILQFSSGGGMTVTGNKISNVGIGIFTGDPGDTYKTNVITKANIGIEFNCNAPTVTSNTVNDSGTGFDQVPSSFGGSNKFYSVSTIRTDGCGSGPTKEGPGLPGKPGVPLPAPGH